MQQKCCIYSRGFGPNPIGGAYSALLCLLAEAVRRKGKGKWRKVGEQRKGPPPKKKIGYRLAVLINDTVIS